ncbi:MAG: 50S ribosomal protein L7ae-like protein [Clostridiales bacterium]|nr:50S ribosomal protein L7ae-like protein [Clostridiales bacterium]
MPDRLKKRSMRVAGVRQVLRGLKENGIGQVFLALDAAPHLRQQIEQAAREAGVPVATVATMEELAQLCRIDVPSAAAGIRKEAASSGRPTGDDGPR